MPCSVRRSTATLGPKCRLIANPEGISDKSASGFALARTVVVMAGPYIISQGYNNSNTRGESP